MNPFVKDGHIIPLASINSVYIDDTLASDLFRIELLVNDIENNRDNLGFSSSILRDEIIKEFKKALVSEIPSIKECALSIASRYGHNLSMVIKTLVKPSLMSVNKRKDWTDIHWGYWKTINQIFILGGLTSPLLTKIFIDEISKTFEKYNIKNLNITFIEDSQDMGTKGLCTEVDEGEFLIFDFGQTYIKRRHYIKNGTFPSLDMTLDPIKSDFLFYKHKDDDELKIIASKLDDFMVDTIIDTMNEVDFSGNKLLIAIANYVYKGNIYPSRGGYAKLYKVAKNYENYLSKKLSKRLNKEITVVLYHDTSAMGLLFKEYKNTAVLSLGTAFGVSFPK
ncbi:hypothetical protein CI105_06550 [Candidatus Izimaplasma bacterium ZiA1]|uniref:hypothetical protein n=1 Tax=Candidatus Izimoplasma sp. ZiA1 TaxID=2024899 RepID=UPI000BAA4FBA|nr:hypothetical protein CI105_06550 [Candidatus Izimaplasma bacterium ZiA1]